MRIFRGFRRLADAIETLSVRLECQNELQEQMGPALERLNALELSRHHFEAEMQGAVLRAESQFRAASSSEQRERQLAKANAKHSDAFDFDSEAGQEDGHPVQPVYAGAREAPGLPPVRVGLATNSKAHAVRAKWGG